MLDPQTGDVGQTLALGRLGIVVERTGRSQRHLDVFDAEGGEILGAEMPGQQLARRVGVELPVGQPPQAEFQLFEQGQPQAVRHQHLGRPQPLELARQRLRHGLGQAQIAVGEVQPRQPEPAPHQGQRQQQ